MVEKVGLYACQTDKKWGNSVFKWLFYAYFQFNSMQMYKNNILRFLDYKNKKVR